MDRPLLPWPAWPIRYLLVVILAIPAALAGLPWESRLFGVAFIVAIVGTSRVSRVRGVEFETQLFVAFVPLKSKRHKLKFVVEIEADQRKEASVTDFILFGVFNWIMDAIMKWVWPWMAGEYELWLVTAREKRVLAWRGNSDQDYQDNLAILTSATGATVRRK